MRYLRIFAAARRSRLEAGATRGSVSRDCREAALGFIAGVGRGWGKRDLALWLIGPYADATRHLAHGERTALPNANSSRRMSTMEARIDIAQRLDEVMADTRTKLLAALVKASSRGTLDFACDLLEQGFVRAAEDDHGIEVWVPVDAVRIRLEDRVGALLVADYLNDPIPYATLTVCEHCEHVAFHESEVCPHELSVVAEAS